MTVPSPATEAAARYIEVMAPLTLDGFFDRARALAAIVRLVRDLEAARHPPAVIVESAVDLLPAPADEPLSIWGMSLRDWVRTTAQEALAGPMLDRRHEHRLGG
jgi:hypothetical protein